MDGKEELVETGTRKKAKDALDLIEEEPYDDADDPNLGSSSATSGPTSLEKDLLVFLKDFHEFELEFDANLWVALKSDDGGDTSQLIMHSANNRRKKNVDNQIVYLLVKGSSAQ